MKYQVLEKCTRAVLNEGSVTKPNDRRNLKFEFKFPKFQVNFSKFQISVQRNLVQEISRF